MASPPSPRKTLGDTRKGSADNWKGSAESRKGFRDRRKSTEMKKDPGEAQKGPGEARRRSFSRKGSTGSKKLSFGEDRGVSVNRRVMVDSRRGSSENRRGSGEGRKGSSESRKGSSEDRDSLSATPASVRPNRVPWVTLMRALGRFKLSLPDIRRDYMLASRDPLAVDKELGPRVKYHKVVRRFWGNHQPLAKVRTTRQGQRTQMTFPPPECPWAHSASPTASLCGGQGCSTPEGICEACCATCHLLPLVVKPGDSWRLLVASDSPYIPSPMHPFTSQRPLQLW